ncbi:S1/P1 Nuclease, partial [bacterium]|nr:S1/P1 Nuclease [bacterium]
MKQIISILTLLSTLFGWGNTGHRIVGKVAEGRLTNKAKRQIKNIIGHHDLAYISNWADGIKS